MRPASRCCLATFLSGAIVGLLKFDKGDETMSLFQDLLHRMDYFCGVSNAFTDIRQLDAYVLQAEFVVSSFSGEEGNMRSFQESLLPFLLHQCQENFPLQSWNRKASEFCANMTPSGERSI